MDDFSVSSLSESKNEWCARLLNTLTPSIFQGLKSIFDEAYKLCQDNREIDKYLMTFQNFLTRVPKWNQTIIDTEKNRIIETSGCTYLEELITAVHIIQLKSLTCVRVGSKQKKIDIDVPSVSDFVHKIYIHVARKIYTNIYLFEKGIQPLQIQKNTREVEIMIKECILNTIRDSVPVESILRAYMDETEEQDVEVKEVEEPLPDVPIIDLSANAVGPAQTIVAAQTTVAEQTSSLDVDAKKEIEEYKKTSDFAIPSKLSFSNDDTLVDTKGNTSIINSPKDDKNLEALEKARALIATNEDEEDDDDDDYDNERLTIGENVTLDIIDINDLNKAAEKVELKPPILDFEVLS
jgi:hypothetical protein